MLPHSSSKLELAMNFNAIFKNVKIIKIQLLDPKFKKNARNDRKMLEMIEILLPHSSSKLELPMNFNAIFKNVKIIKIGLLDAKL